MEAHDGAKSKTEKAGEFKGKIRTGNTRKSRLGGRARQKPRNA